MQNMRKSIVKFANKHDDAFGLTESIISILLLSLVVSYATVFISKRLQIIHNANLISAINDEIYRDTQKLKFELWREHLVISKNSALVSSFYDVNTPANRKYCSDIGNTLPLLPSWNPTKWTPNEDNNTVSGQLRNSIFKGKPITITRKLETSSPFDLNYTHLDKSLAKLVYIVDFKGISKVWSSIDLVSDAHSWCDANG